MMKKIERQNMPKVPEGFKVTEAGMIPSDWEEISLNSIVSVLEAGVSVNSVDEIDAYSHGKHILKTSCVFNGHFDGCEKKSILPNDVKRAKCSPVKEAIIVSRMNTPNLVGEIGYVAEDDRDVFLPDRLWQMKIKKDIDVNPKWLAALLSFSPFSKKIKDTATGTSGSMKNISKTAFLSLELPWPTLKEQNIIAKALSDTDELISTIELLIAKKQAIKTSTMQQLLTGRTRLPQFAKHPEGTLKGYKSCEVGLIPEDWDCIYLNSLVSVLDAGVSVNSLDEPDIFSHGKHILKTSCVNNGYFDANEKKSILPIDVTRAKCSPVKGGIIISRMNTPALVGEIGYVAEDEPYVFLPDRLWQMKLRKDVDNNPRWLAYLLSFPLFSHKIKEAATGTSGSMKNISKDSLLSLQIPLPKPQEQIAIATILSDMDAELVTLEKKLAKVRDIKQGMMQQLLTGRIRLPLDHQS